MTRRAEMKFKEILLLLGKLSFDFIIIIFFFWGIFCCISTLSSFFFPLSQKIITVSKKGTNDPRKEKTKKTPQKREKEKGGEWAT